MIKSKRIFYQPRLPSAQVEAKVSQLQKDYRQVQQEELYLQEEIKRLDDERQEFTPQINALYEKERGVQRTLTPISQFGT
ncbi:MAG: hypothetical protein HYU84_05310 [Chloroflexi bacterium]|nr:hypothetical protein [Chloroflexota bacterium]MBI3166911.1 hypothetical protein [Chloroflexota bacterium]